MEAYPDQLPPALAQEIRPHVSPGIAEAMRAAFPPLEQVTKPNLTTEEAAYYLNRRPQTLRIWACKETGPLRPNRMFGRLDWPTHKVRALAQGSAQ